MVQGALAESLVEGSAFTVKWLASCRATATSMVSKDLPPEKSGTIPSESRMTRLNLVRLG